MMVINGSCHNTVFIFLYIQIKDNSKDPARGIWGMVFKRDWLEAVIKRKAIREEMEA